MKSYIEIPRNSDFTVANLPFGIFSTQEQPEKHIGVAIGDSIIDLAYLADRHWFSNQASELEPVEQTCRSNSLNAFAGLGKEVRILVRALLSQALLKESQHNSVILAALVKRSEASMHLPFVIGDYTDFYAGQNHARNVSMQFIHFDYFLSG